MRHDPNHASSSGTGTHFLWMPRLRRISMLHTWQSVGQLNQIRQGSLKNGVEKNNKGKTGEHTLVDTEVFVNVCFSIQDIGGFGTKY